MAAPDINLSNSSDAWIQNMQQKGFHIETQQGTGATNQTMTLTWDVPAGIYPLIYIFNTVDKDPALKGRVASMTGLPDAYTFTHATKVVAFGALRASANISSVATHGDGICEATTATAHGLAVNERVLIAGFSGGNAGYNGTWRVLKKTSTTKFVFGATFVATGTGTSEGADGFVPTATELIIAAFRPKGGLVTQIQALVTAAGGGYIRQDSTGTIAKETGGNLATVKTNTDPLVTAAGGGYIRQDSTGTIAKETGGNLATVKTNTDPLVTAAGGGYIRQDSTGTIAKETGGNLATIAGWDDGAGRADINPIASQSGIAGGEGAASASTTRIVEATSTGRTLSNGTLDGTTALLTLVQAVPPANTRSIAISAEQGRHAVSGSADNGSGKLQLTVPSGHGIVAGDAVYISIAGGNNVADWYVCTAAAATTIDFGDITYAGPSSTGYVQPQFFFHTAVIFYEDASKTIPKDVVQLNTASRLHCFPVRAISDYYDVQFEGWKQDVTAGTQDFVQKAVGAKLAYSISHSPVFVMPAPGSARLDDNRVGNVDGATYFVFAGSETNWLGLTDATVAVPYKGWDKVPYLLAELMFKTQDTTVVNLSTAGLRKNYNAVAAIQPEIASWGNITSVSDGATYTWLYVPAIRTQFETAMAYFVNATAKKVSRMRVSLIF